MKILVFSLLLFGGVLGFGSAVFAQGAVLYFEPAAGTYTAEEVFRVNVLADTHGENVHTVAASFVYPKDKVEVLEIEKEDSILTLLSREVSENGKVMIVGSGAAFSGVQIVASIRMRAIIPSGIIQLGFDDESAILRDEDDQNILSLPSSGNAEFQIEEAEKSLPFVPNSQDNEGAPVEENLEIFDVVAEQIAPDSIRISWKTTKKANSKVEYGAGEVSEFSIVDRRQIQDHSILVVSMSDAVNYRFQIKNESINGEVQQKEFTLQEVLREIQLVQNPQEGTPPLLEIADEQGEADEEGEGGISGILIAGLALAAVLIIAFIFFQQMRKSRGGLGDSDLG